MHTPPRWAGLLLASALALPAAAEGLSCETLREQIGAKIRAGGVSQFTLVIAEQSAKVEGRVVGSCGRGSRKIVYTAGKGSSGDAILTECKDGTVSVGGRCGR
ncbi:MAG: DUF1161 domain-containing protein [Rubrivivax sp.]|jgi:hypothetical protein|nr:DUF1161 domain-containing protein [Rubrivivax sp.]